MSSSQEKATIVTAYFEIPRSKHTHELYDGWIKNMLSIDNPMVIFCCSKSYEKIKKIRENHLSQTIIIPTSFEEFYTFRYFSVFEEQQKMDMETSIGHNTYLYMIWNEKIHFLKRALEMDPFQTDYFLWVDMGCFRESLKPAYQKWPCPKKIAQLEKNKVTLMEVHPFSDYEKYGIKSLEQLPCYDRNEYNTRNNFLINHISASIFGGNKKALLEWHEKYFNLLEYFISQNRFIGKDQSIMNCLYLLNQNLGQLIKHHSPFHYSELFFYLQRYLSSDF